ncbi:MAG: DNA polymerase III subunit beta [Gemmiger sp.]|uniref:Beta sliding clamp n=1 Tax=Subdoligranulum variabile TaxID=214851 RepID=A0A921LNQ9_9FIRM|nr:MULTISPECIES: DNA polymerase III subunit beta [Gemmiger]MBM6899912.1 DNA polymerase III subunit beta [Gemmiger formicilis]MEE0707220.1 DNA polymerase III subunit beta [Gemmiger sp.]HJG28961.1 DNA polymerase III subunit beta [Subdoligranulum variabile]
MKFECEKSLLASAIEGVSRAITNRSAIPVLEGIYLKAEGFNLTLTGYDMEMGITTTIECNVLVPGETVLEAKLLLSMVSRMPAGDVRIELTDEGQAIISGGVAEFEIPALNASDYPSLPVTGADNTMTIPTSMMRELIEKTIYAVSQDDKKPAHTGELFVIEPGSLTIVALDGYRLAIIQRDVECTRDIRIIIPAKTLQELLKIMGGPDDPVKIDANRRYVVFTTNGYTIMSRLIEGDFLNYESVIPKDKRTRVTVDCKTFINTIERASLIITERLKNPLRITFGEDKVTVRCQTPLGKVVDEFAPVEMTGDPVEIGFNNRYLLDAMRYSKCERMVLEINGPLSPVKILPEDGKDFIYLVLPVRFKNEG